MPNLFNCKMDVIGWDGSVTTHDDVKVVARHATDIVERGGRKYLEENGDNEVNKIIFHSINLVGRVDIVLD